MIAIATDAIFDTLCHLLAGAFGPERALTIDEMALAIGCTKSHPATEAEVPDRRPVEEILEKHLRDFPFLLVAGSQGYYRPTAADQINRYKHNLRSRHEKLKLREDIVDVKAAAEGWPAAGDWFCDPPSRQGELFA